MNIKRKTVKPKIISALLIIAVMMITPGWFNWDNDWENVVINRVNMIHTGPTDRDTAPEATVAEAASVEAKPPLTIGVQILPSDEHNISVIQAELQISTSQNVDSEWTDWTTVASYDDPDQPINEPGPATFFRGYTISDAYFTPGDTIAVRLYISNDSEGYENADKALSTTGNGNNGWEDPWVVVIDTQSGSRPVY